MSQDKAGSQGGMAEQIRAELDGELLENAEDAGVDVEEIIQHHLSKHDYGPSIIANFADAAIRRKVESAAADVIQGIVMGSRDRFGSNAPRWHSLVRSNGEHLEVSTWDSTLPAADGSEVAIPVGGSKVTMRANYQEQYDSYEGKAIEGAEPVEHGQLVENLGKVAIGPDQITPRDEYDIVLVEGTISYIDTQTVFEDGEPGPEGPVLMEDGRGELRPHMEIGLVREGDTSVRGHLERLKNANPYLAVSDFDKLTRDAYENFEDPEAQAKFINDGLRGTDVFFVGNVNSYNKNRSDDGEVTNYVEIALSAIVEKGDYTENADLTEMAEDEIDESPTETAVGGASEDPAEEEDESPSEGEASPEDGDEGGDEDSYDASGLPFDPAEETIDGLEERVAEIEDKTVLAKILDAEERGKARKGAREAIESRAAALREPDGEPEEPEEPEGPPVAKVREDIEQWAGLVGEDIEDLTAETVAEKMAIDAPLSVIEYALSDEADQSDTGSEESADGPLSAFEALEENGMYQCPLDGGDCLGKGSSEADLIDHALDEHGFDSPEEAKEAILAEV